MLAFIKELKFKKDYKNILFLLAIAVLVVMGINNFLLFHVLVELLSVFMALAIFLVIYNFHTEDSINFIVILGVAYFFVGGFTLFHTLLYEGMNIFSYSGLNLAMQLKIVGKFLAAGSLLVAIRFFHQQRKSHVEKVFIIFTIITGVILGSIYLNIFFDTYTAVHETTQLRMISEYIILGILLLSFYQLLRYKDEFHDQNYKYLFAVIIFAIVSETGFIFYANTHHGFNIFSHLMQFISFSLIYKIAINYTIIHPKALVEQRLKKSLERLELGINGANLGLWDWNTQTNEVIYNKQWAEMLGYDLQELDYSLETWNRLMHPEDRKKTYENLEKHFTGQTEFYKDEHRLKTKAGDYKWIRDIGKVVERDDQGDVLRVVGIHIDIDDEKRTYEQMKVEKAKFQQLFDNSNEGIALLDNDVKIIDINQKFEALFNYSEAEAIGHYIDDLITPEEFKTEGTNYSHRVIDGNAIVKEVIRQKNSGEKFYVSMHAFPITLDGGQIGIYAAYRDITERKKGEEYIKYLSFHDELTGLYNRRYFEAEIERLDGTRALPVGIIMGDLDELKYINDNFGHATGDEYIKSIAEIIASQLRTEDIVARVGGDEFAIILPNADEHICQDVCDRIKTACEQVSEDKGLIRPIEISLGYAVKEKKETSLEKVFIAADQAMYEGKIAN